MRQGQVISPLLANLYLHDLDVFVQKRSWGWVRYADDFLLLCRDEAEAVDANSAVSEFIRGIHLSLNANATPVTSLDRGFDFLGVRFQGATRSIAAAKLDKMGRVVDWLLSPKSKYDLETVLEKLRTTVEGWRRYYTFLSPWQEFSQINSRIDSALRTLLAVRRTHKSVTKEAVKPLLAPHLPSGNDWADMPSTIPLLSLWGEDVVNVASQQQSKENTTKKIGKRRRQYVRKEVAGNELFVTTPGAYIGKKGERVVVRNKQSILGELPVTQLRNISVAGGGVSLSSDVIRLCADRGITLTFLDHLGKPYAVVKTPEGVDAELVLRQMEHRDDEVGLQLARMFVWAKMKNQLALLKSYSKYQTRKNSRFSESAKQAQGNAEPYR